MILHSTAWMTVPGKVHPFISYITLSTLFPHQQQYCSRLVRGDAVHDFRTATRADSCWLALHSPHHPTRTMDEKQRTLPFSENGASKSLVSMCYFVRMFVKHTF
jgi:hypothetical protein